MGIETIALIAGAAAATAGTANTVYQSNKQADLAKDQAGAARKMRAEAEEKMRQEESTTAARDARARQQQLAGTMKGRRSTILTGPLGIPQTQALGGSGRAATY